MPSDNDATSKTGPQPLQADELKAFAKKRYAALVRSASDYLRKRIALNDESAPSDCVNKALVHLLARIVDGDPPLLESEKHLNNYIFYLVRMKCNQYIIDITTDRPVDPDAAPDEHATHDETAPFTRDIVLQVHANKVLHKLQLLNYPLPLVLDFLLDRRSAKYISLKLGVTVDMAYDYIAEVRKHITAALVVWFPWLSRPKSRMIAGTAIVAAVLLQPPNDPGCHTNTGAPGEPTLCVEVKHFDATDGLFRVCKQGGPFQTPQTIRLRNYNRPEFAFRSHEKLAFSGPLDFPHSGPIQFVKAGDVCTSWNGFDASKAMEVDAIVAPSAQCTNPDCWDDTDHWTTTGRVAIPKQNK